MIIDKDQLVNKWPNCKYYGPIGIAPFKIDKGRRFSDDQGNQWQAGEDVPANHMAVVDRDTGLIVPLTFERCGDIGWMVNP